MARNPSASSAFARLGRSIARRGLIGLLLASAASLGACKSEQPAAEAPQPVRVMAVRADQDTRATSYVGVSVRDTRAISGSG